MDPTKKIKASKSRVIVLEPDELFRFKDKLDTYCLRSAKSTPFQLPAWSQVLIHTYKCRVFTLLAFPWQETLPSSSTAVNTAKAINGDEIIGILSLVHIRHPLICRQLVSMPFCDNAGIIADDDSVAEGLCEAAIEIGRRLDVDTVELRHSSNLKSNGISIHHVIDAMCKGPRDRIITEKDLMVLDLPADPDDLMGSFKAKLRSQIRRPMKAGLTATIGGLELVNDFYQVFCENMRDLGSPVHSKKLFANVLSKFPGSSHIVVVYDKIRPLAGSVMIGHKDVLYNPWASSLREYSKLSPNMLLYWTMLEFACGKGYCQFNFGRSTPGEGTYRFKEQWGAKPVPLSWHVFTISNNAHKEQSDKQRFGKAVQYWQKLPLPVTRWIGPYIRKHISL